MISSLLKLFQVKYGRSYDLNKEILKFYDDVKKFLKSKTQDIVRADMKDLYPNELANKIVSDWLDRRGY